MTMQEPTFFILTALVRATPLHGYGIIQAVEQLSGGRVKLKAGTLYAALDRLSTEGLIVLDREEAVGGRLRRYYTLSDDGRAALEAAVERLQSNAKVAASRLREAFGFIGEFSMPDLERSYRRLLWAYPGFYRRERGLEILTTLLDAAEPGQVRPSRGEAVHLLVNGLRYRFVPPTWVGRLAAGLVAIWAAVVLSGAGALAVWGLANPEDPNLAAFSDDLVGRPASLVYELPDDNPLNMAYAYRTYGEFQDFAEEGWDGGPPAPMGQSRVYEQVAETPTVLADAYQHLTSAGWRTGARSPGGVNSRAGGNSPNEVFWAYQDGVLLRVSEYDNQTGMTISAYPIEPHGVLAGAVAGFVIGLIVVLQGMTWTAHRVARTPRPIRWLILLLGLPALIACGVNTLDNVLSMIPDPGSANVLFAADYMYPLANQIANPLAASVIALALTGSLGLIAGAARMSRLQPANAAASTGGVAEH